MNRQFYHSKIAEYVILSAICIFGGILFSIGLKTSISFLREILILVGAAIMFVTILIITWNINLRKWLIKDINQIVTKTIENINQIVTKTNSLQKSKILQICYDANEIKWKDYFTLSTNHVDIFFSYGNTWRGANELTLEDFLSNKNNKNGMFRIILPDYRDIGMITELAKRFEKDTEELENRIRKAIQDFVAIDHERNHGNVTLQIWLTRIAPVFTAYRFDDIIVSSMYSHKGKKKVPHFVLQNGGEFYFFIHDQLETILTESNGIAKKVFDSSSKRLAVQVGVIPFIIINSKAQYLLFKRTPERGGFWQFVTGGVNFNEELTNAAYREFHEETQLESDITSIGFDYEFPVSKEWSIYHPKGTNMKESIFVANLSSNSSTKPVPTIDSREHSEYRYMALEEALECLTYSENKKALLKADEYIKGRYKTT